MKDNKIGHIILMTGCSNDCIFCLLGKDHIETEESIKKQEFKAWNNLLKYKKEGIKDIEVSGSDPLEYKKIIPMLKCIKKMGFNSIKIATHGKNLSNFEFAKKIVLSGADIFTIPIYGSNNLIHESVSGIKGSFEETISGIENIKKLNKKIAISCLVLEQNKNNLIDILKLGTKYNVMNFCFNMTYLVKDDSNYIIPVKDIGKYMANFFKYIIKTKANISFNEFPYCVFTNIDSEILINSNKIFNSQKKYTFLGDKSGSIQTPPFKVKIKHKICKNCKANNICDGFFKTDIEKFGVGNLKSLK